MLDKIIDGRNKKKKTKNRFFWGGEWNVFHGFQVK